MEINPEAAKEELLKIEKSRAEVRCVTLSEQNYPFKLHRIMYHALQARMQLRHRNTSQWAKQLLRSDPDNQSAKDFMQEQQKLREQLRKKITLDSDGEHDSDVDHAETAGAS